MAIFVTDGDRELQVTLVQLTFSDFRVDHTLYS